jgi:para-nitrobenzyl esterase
MTAGIAANLGMAPTREAFAAASTEELVAAQTRLASMSDGGGPVSLARRFATGLLPFGPSPDGDLLPATPIERIAAGAGAAVPVLAGNTSQEFNITASRSAGDLDQTVLLDALAALGLPPAAAPDHVPQGSRAPTCTSFAGSAPGTAWTCRSSSTSWTPRESPRSPTTIRRKGWPTAGFRTTRCATCAGSGRA